MVMCIFLFMVCLQLTLMKNCVPAARPYRASKSNYFFMLILMISYALSIIILSYAIGRCVPSRSNSYCNRQCISAAANFAVLHKGFLNV